MPLAAPVTTATFPGPMFHQFPLRSDDERDRSRVPFSGVRSRTATAPSGTSWRRLEQPWERTADERELRIDPPQCGPVGGRGGRGPRGRDVGVDRRAARRDLRAHRPQAGHADELAGIEARRWWPAGVTFDEAAAMAGQKAIDASGIDPSPSRHAHLDVGVQAPPRAVGRVRRAPPPPAPAQQPELRRRQRLPRLHQRHVDRRRGHRLPARSTTR